MRYKVIFICLIYSLDVYCQDGDAKSRLAVGVNLRASSKSLLEFQAGYLRVGKLGASLKVSSFNYEEETFVHVNSNYVSPSIGARYFLNGYCIKPGVVLFTRFSKRTNMNLTFSGVVTRANHNLVFTYSDGLGWTERHNPKIRYHFGIEIEYNYNLIFLKRMYIGLAATAGFKPYRVKIYNDVIPDFPSYSSFAPGQGTAKSAVYCNVTLNIGMLLMK